MCARSVTLAALLLTGACQAYDREVYAVLADAAAQSDDGAPNRDDGVDAALDAAPVDGIARTDVAVDARRVDGGGDVAANNQLTNASFENTTLSPWYLYVLSGAAAATVVRDGTTAAGGTYSARVDVTARGSMSTYAQVAQNSVSLVAGRSYTVSFAARSIAEEQGDLQIQQAAPPFTVYAVFRFVPSTTWQRFTYTFVAPEDMSNAVVVFALGLQVGTTWIDDVAFSL